MSLAPEDSRRRGRSRSPGRERSRSRGDDGAREVSRARVVTVDRVPSPPTSRYDEPRYDVTSDRRRAYYEEEPLKSAMKSPSREDARYRDSSAILPGPSSDYAMPGSFVGEEDVQVRHADGKGKGFVKEHKTSRSYYSSSEDESPERPRYGKPDQRSSYTQSDAYRYDEDSQASELKRREEVQKKARDAYLYEQAAKAIAEKREADKRERQSLHANFSGSAEAGRSRSPGFAEKRGSFSRRKEDPLAYGEIPPTSASKRSSYMDPRQWVKPEEKTTYSPRREGHASQPQSRVDDRNAYGPRKESSTGQAEYGPPHRSSPRNEPSSHVSQERIVTVEPSQRRTSSIGGLAPHMNTLSVNTGSHSLHVAAGQVPLSLANAPGSPLLEAYHGTYQSISPMPSPLMLPAQPYNSSLQSLDTFALSGPLSPARTKHARFHDVSSDAAAIAKALKNAKRPDTDPLITLLPALSHEQIMDLRVEYKKLVKTGSERKGVNIAKHIKLCLKEEDPSLMKACYTVALGKWESEAYWANFWYQGEKSRRELLIESLMGRSNAEIRAIKDGFSDKKYSDSLTKCMRTELKEDKFKKAILLVLDENKMEDDPRYGVDRHLVEEDVRTLHKCVRSERGGETTMIQIIVQRSDPHMREVLRLYESTYRTNFAREMLKKSGNLVGELLAHILNGIINRPVRDALLLNHALSLTKHDVLRTELLISRLVRYHWDVVHMESVKREYKLRYKVDLVVAVREGTKGKWGEFCEELCVRRMPDEVKRIDGGSGRGY